MKRKTTERQRRWRRSGGVGDTPIRSARSANFIVMDVMRAALAAEVAGSQHHAHGGRAAGDAGTESGARGSATGAGGETLGYTMALGDGLRARIARHYAEGTACTLPRSASL